MPGSIPAFLLPVGLALAALAALPAAEAADLKPPELPCQDGIAGTDCAVGALDCAAGFGTRTGSDSYVYARAWCRPPTWYPCELAYADTQGEVRSCLVA